MTKRLEMHELKGLEIRHSDAMFFDQYGAVDSPESCVYSALLFYAEEATYFIISP